MSKPPPAPPGRSIGVYERPAAAERARRLRRWLPWLLALVGIVWLVLFFVV